MKRNIQKKVFIVFIPLLAAVIIFSSAALCNTCAMIPGKNDFSTVPGEVISALQDQNNGMAQKTGENEDTGTGAVDADPGYENNTIGQEEGDGLKGPGQQNESTSVGESSKDLNSGEVLDNVSPGAEKIILADSRLVISIDSIAGRGTEWSFENGNDPSFYETIDYFINIGIPKEQILCFWGQDELGGTFENLRLAVDTIRLSSDKNCTVYVFLMSHGHEDNPETGLEAGMEFANGEGNEHGGEIKSYYEISRMLDQIKCKKMVVITHSCASSDSVAPLTANTGYPRISMAPITIQEILNYIMTDSSKVDINNDERISILDVYNFIKDPEMTSNPARYEGVELNDHSGIASDIFLN